MATGGGPESATRMDAGSLSLTSGTKRAVMMLAVVVHSNGSSSYSSQGSKRPKRNQGNQHPDTDTNGSSYLFQELIPFR